VTASLNGKVGVLIGNGNGTFQTAVAYGSGGYNSISVAVGDINGDSTPDLLLANECGNKSCTNGGIGVLLGNGDGTFQTAVSYSSGAWGARSVALGDVNGDTLPDLVVANEYLNDPNGNGEVSILLGNGNGTFQPAVVYGSGGYRSLSIAVSDLNADGRPDLLADNDCRIGNDCRKGAVGVLINTSTATTTTTLASSLNPSRYGQAITLTSTVTADGAGVPDGTVTFADGATQLGTATLLNGTASLITSTLIGGTRSLTASYSAEGWFAASTSPSLTQVVARASVKATIGSSTNPSHVNQMVTFSALVSGSPTTPTGAVTFKKGTAILATAPLVGGQATFTTAFTKAGSFSIVASYSGDQNYLPRNSKAVKQVVQKYSTSTSLNSTPNPSVHGEAVKFTATVASAGLMPTGKVKFMDGTVTLGTATLNGGVAMLSKSKLAVGTHLIKAFYLGDNGSDKSTSIVLDQVVN